MNEPDQTSLRVAIFGATSDIAVAVARRYARTGARLVLVGRDPGRLEAYAADLKVRGAGAVVCKRADFAELGETSRVATDAWDAFDGLDVALVAYGSLPNQSITQASAEGTVTALMLNFVSPAVLAGELASLFERQKSGVIAVITSVAGDRGRKSNYIYGSAKGGLQRFLEGLRHRLYAASVTVLDIRPGFVASKMTAHLRPSGPLWATPEKVATDITKAIASNRTTLYTPWFWRIILMIVRLIPGPLFHRSSL